MKTIRCWDDLSQFGIVALTGEACGLSYRILCDVTAQGKKILEKAFGLPELRLAESWNPGAADDPHVGSVMLAPEVLNFVGVFALLENGCTEVLQSKAADCTALSRMIRRIAWQDSRGYTRMVLGRRFAYAGTAGDRNQHVMSGRVH